MTGVSVALADWLFFTVDALLDLCDYERISSFALSVLPYVTWAALGLAALIAVQAIASLTLRVFELALVLLLLLLSLPQAALRAPRSALRLGSRRDTDCLTEEPPVPARVCPSIDSNWAPSRQGLPAPARVDRALVELGVPLCATDDDISHAYATITRDLYAQLLRDESQSRREACVRRLAHLNAAYETALGNVPR